MLHFSHYSTCKNKKFATVLKQVQRLKSRIRIIEVIDSATISYLNDFSSL